MEQYCGKTNQEFSIKKLQKLEHLLQPTFACSFSD